MAARPYPEQLITLARLFDRAGVPLYAVGGAVRNTLLHLPWEDMDVCSAMTPDAALALAKEAGITCIPTAPELGTVVFLLDGIPFEHTTFRGERYAPGGRHRPEAVSFDTDLTADARRRDFTVNALYYDPLRGEILDPTGGRDDLAKRVLRSAGDPADTMSRDALRILRLARFCGQLGFTPEAETLAAAKAHAAGLADVAWERKRRELELVLLCDVKYGQAGTALASPVLDALHLLTELGAMAYLLPELLRGDGLRQHVKFHRYDVMEHNFRACAAAPADRLLRLCMLLHDVGKPYAVAQSGIPAEAALDWRAYGAPRSPMQGHDELGAELAEEILQRLRWPKAESQQIVQLIRYHMYDLSGVAKESTLRARFAELGRETSLQLCDVREADIRGSGMEPDYVAERWRTVLADMEQTGALFREEDLCCTGKDIMDWLHIAPGPLVGEIKHRLFLQCARQPSDNEPAQLRRLALGMIPGGKGRG